MSRATFLSFRRGAAAVLGLVAMLIAAAPAEAAGYWRYSRTEIKPTQAELDANYHHAGSKTDAKIDAAFQVLYAGLGTVNLYFRTTDADDKTFTSRVLFTFRTSSDISVLVPGTDLDFTGTVQISSNFPGAYAYGRVAGGNADYTVDTSAKVGKDGSGEGTMRVPGGGPGSSFWIYGSAYLANDGALGGSVTVYYDWVEGTPPPPEPKPEPKPGPAPTPTGADFGGNWTSNQGDMALGQDGSQVAGTYNSDNGQIQGTVSGDRLTGYWAEASSMMKCDVERLGSMYWGRIDWVMSADGTHFDGHWSYCDEEPTHPWTGDRVGGAPSASDESSARPGDDETGTNAPASDVTILSPSNDADGMTISGDNDDGAPGTDDQGGGADWTATPAPDSRLLQDNWNRSACQMTDQVTLTITRPTRLDRFELWIKWPADTLSLPYRVLAGGSDVGGGEVHRGDCDPYQTNWCSGADNPRVKLAPGDYKIRLERKAICQNAESGHAGFLRAWGR